MRIVAISDTHGFQEQIKIPYGDILIHAGDFTRIGHPVEIIKFNDWLGRLPHKHKLIIAGNHDRLFEADPSFAKSLLFNATYLQDEEVIINGIKFYGSPWQPEFCNWAFNLPRDGEELKAKWAAIPDNVNVLITHGPPYAMLDKNLNGVFCGCKLLKDRVSNLSLLKHHIFGHIHLQYGVYPDPEALFINASICDESYQPVNKPIVVDL